MNDKASIWMPFFILKEGGKSMKTFNFSEVSKYAIDKPNHRQLFVSDKYHRHDVMKLLIEMQFTLDFEHLLTESALLPIVINTEKKTAHIARPFIMACVVTSGGKTIDYQTFLSCIENNDVK